MCRQNRPIDDGWQASANAWIVDQGEHGDFGRRYVLDPVMLPRALARAPRRVLDVGCGEGRFCRMLAARGVPTTGIDPTPALLAVARRRHPAGVYLRGVAEHLPLALASFDLVVSYLTLIDIPDAHAAIREMTRVLRPGGTLLVANLASFNTASANGFIRGRITGYLRPRSVSVSYRGIRVVNHHRPLRDYMQAFLDAGLRLVHFDEPSPVEKAPEPKASRYRDAPWFVVMEWEKPRG